MGEVWAVGILAVKGVGAGGCLVNPLKKGKIVT